jgi:flagellar hook-associated protein 2
MAVRMSGLISGMDTETIIKELMTAKSTKKTKLEQQKTKLEWKQEKWADLNTKIYKLYTEQLSKIRLPGSYATKKVTSSNENIVTATAASSAGSGSHKIEIKDLASAQYVTGGKVSVAGLKGGDTLIKAGMTEGTVIKISIGTGSNTQVKNVEVTKNTTINDLVNTMKEAGLNASFDEGQGRFFINGKNSGDSNVFTIQTYKMDSDLSDKLTVAATGLKETVGLTDEQVSSYSALLEDLISKENAYKNSADKVTTWTNLQAAKKKVADMEESFYKQSASKAITLERLTELKKAQSGASTSTEVQDVYKQIQESVQKNYFELDSNGNITETYTGEVLKNAKNAFVNQATSIVNQKMNDKEDGYDFPDEASRNAAIQVEYEKLVGADEASALRTKADELYNASIETALSNSAKTYVSTDKGAEAVQNKYDELKNEKVYDDLLDAYKEAHENYITRITDTVNDEENRITNLLSSLGLADMDIKSEDGKFAVDFTNKADGFTLTEASDAVVVLDGATLSNTSNIFTVAGVTYNLKDAKVGTVVNVNVTNDTQAVYDMVKNFVTAYNDILTEMNTLYNASTAKGYDPLTSDEKEAMSDKQIELWEDKIKDSLLRRDDKLGSVITAMRTSLQSSVQVNGKNYSLSSFGIVTGAYTEKGLLHIEGDADDSNYSVKTNKLMKAITEDPDTVAEALAGIANNLYASLQDKQKTSSVSSALTFYNDKEMKSQITSYTKQIAVWETRLKDMENRYYKQFSAMETALAKIQSSGNSLSGLFGN